MRKICEELQPRKFLVMGDLMVDEYITGKVCRISPEAPIPVLEFVNSMRAPGGAANVAMNLAGLGNHVELAGTVGEDEPGRWLLRCLNDHGVRTGGIFCDRSRATTVKTRFSTKQQSILRVDHEDTRPVAVAAASKISAYLDECTQNNRVDGLLVSDYNKGLISGDGPLMSLLQKLKSTQILCGVDTKKKGPGLNIFNGFDIIKPNLSELAGAVGVQVSFRNLPEACKNYLAMSGAVTVIVTLGEDGIYYYNGSSGVYVPSVATSVYDVTGAGDTVFAVIMHARANGLNWTETARLANIAASAVISSRGTKAISPGDLSRRLEVIENKEAAHFEHAPAAEACKTAPGTGENNSAD